MCLLKRWMQNYILIIFHFCLPLDVKGACPKAQTLVSRGHNKRQEMSKSLDSSFQSNTSISGVGQLSQNVSWNTITTPSQFVVSTPSSMAGPSVPKKPSGHTSSFTVASTSTKTKSFSKKCRAPDDEETSKQTAARSVCFCQIA